MSLKGLKRTPTQGPQDKSIDDFISGATKRVSELKVSEQKYKRYTFSLTEDVSEQIDELVLDSRVAKANRSIIIKAALNQLQKLSNEELKEIVLKELF